MNRGLAPVLVLASLALLAGCAPATQYAGLRALEPKRQWVPTPTPVLRWQAFPRPTDEALFGPDARRRIADVTYDVRLWRDRSDRSKPPPPPTATGLREPVYAVTTPLKWNIAYYWTVRAHFTLDGQPRVTQWTQKVRDRNWCSDVDEDNAMSLMFFRSMFEAKGPGA